MGSQYSVTGPYGHTFSFLDIMGSQDSVSGPYGQIFSFLDIMGSQDSVTGPYGHTFFFLDIMGVKTPSTGHMATYSHFPISWAVKISSLVLFKATQSPFPSHG
ncbi:hypothetical protein BgiBS90_015874 [Biomphalaria glabrata]|nr:hypothetical protein BgiBS90_015874 [Biomphalaria glabrata]